MLASTACGQASVGQTAGARSTPASGVGPSSGAVANPAPAAARDVSGTGFVHPGILVSRPLLDFVKGKIAAGAEPWKSALAKAQASEYGSLGYTPHPRAVVECGSYSNPDLGCSDEKGDAIAAYTQALIYAYTGEEAHAKKAIEIMNAWSALIKDHTNSNAPLQSAWAAQVLPRAAEIIRYQYPGWPASEVARFGKMLRDVYLPKVVNGSAANGNWETSMVEATMNIGIFNDDRASFDRAVKMWRARVPAYVYLAKDGPTPNPPPRGNKTGAALVKYWYGQSTMMVGLAQETCRDLRHVQLAFGGIINAAETARLQGVDLYGAERERLEATLEFHARLLNGAPVPSELCGGALRLLEPEPTWEIALNHFVNRLGDSLPETQKLAQSIRPTATTHHMDWETLTHASAGAP
ncbi:MAG TPA: alginate lyase family protein [Polyangiaceae bacterium]|nr:alginate lyase family protein [Polyangiaceae bacterium]